MNQNNKSALFFYPSIAVKIGLECAIILQEMIHVIVSHKDTSFIIMTHEEWKENHFPFLSVETIKHEFSRLQNMGLVSIGVPKNNKFADNKFYFMMDIYEFENTRKLYGDIFGDIFDEPEI